MARQFDPRKVLKQIANTLLEDFFASRGELLSLPWDTLKETEVQPVFEAWQALPEPKRREVQVILQDVNELADERGLAVLADEVALRDQDKFPAFVAQSSRTDKALWVYLNIRAAFEEAARFARADALSFGRYWHKRNGLPRAPADAPPLAVTDEMKTAIASALTQYYAHTQGRGQHCHIEHYRRSNGNEYFFTYLADYPDMHLSFDDGGAMRRHHERGAFDNVFVYRPDAGTLGTFVRGGKKVREALVSRD